jgi:hypothetical protein
MIGPWRDPISGRWIVQKPSPVAGGDPNVTISAEQELTDRLKREHIWRAVESSAAASQITGKATD